MALLIGQVTEQQATSKSFERGSGNPVKARLAGVDAGRYIAFIAVVLIHTVAQGSPDYGVSFVRVIDQVCRLAVPFFFLASGFFLAKRNLDGSSRIVQSVVRRIAPLYLFWFLFYVAVTASWGALAPEHIAWMFITGGPGYHLWFLPVLGFSLVGIAISQRLIGCMPLFCITALLYLGGLAIGSYGYWQSGTSSAVSRMLCGPVFVLLGSWLFQSERRFSLNRAWLLFFLGAATQLVEAYVLDAKHITLFHKNDFLVGTLLLGLGAFLIALNINAQGRLLRVLAKLGIFSFGMYAVHLFFISTVIEQYGSIIPITYFAGKFILPLIVATLATVSVVLFSRFKPARLLLA